jgi:hypothetical protein
MMSKSSMEFTWVFHLDLPTLKAQRLINAEPQVPSTLTLNTVLATGTSNLLPTITTGSLQVEIVATMTMSVKTLVVSLSTPAMLTSSKRPAVVASATGLLTKFAASSPTMVPLSTAKLNSLLPMPASPLGISTLVSVLAAATSQVLEKAAAVVLTGVMKELPFLPSLTLRNAKTRMASGMRESRTLSSGSSKHAQVLTHILSMISAQLSLATTCKVVLTA